MNSIPALLDISEVQPLSPEDLACLKEIKAVLAKHGRVNRFGFTLLHKHFPMSDDEILVESCDHAARTLTLRPVIKESLADDQIVNTNWHFTESNDEPVVIVTCRSSGPKGLIH